MASTSGGPASTCGPGRMAKTHPRLFGYSSYCSTCTKAGCSSAKATLDADARSTYHQHSQRLIHAFIIKLIAAAAFWPATHQQANCKAISKVLQSAARYDG